MAKTIVGLFDSRDTAVRAVDDLKDAGFRRSDIDISIAEGEVAPTEPHPERKGFFASLFSDDDEDQVYYSEGLRRGHVAVTVEADDLRADDAAAILNRHSPLDLDRESRRWAEDGWTGKSGKTGESIPVAEEQVSIGKRAIERGGVRIYSRVVERPVSEDVSLRDERVNVERHKVDRPATASDRAFQDRVIEARETDEEAVVSKTSRVTEEVSLSKDTRERKERVEDTERHTEVEVEHLKGGRDDPQPRR